jgi:hypothetical protein
MILIRVVLLGYPTRQPVVLQGTTGGYLNNLQVPQVQLAY